MLTIKIERGVFVKDNDFIGKMVRPSYIQDPYVVVRLDEEEKKTSVKDEAGKNPVWN